MMDLLILARELREAVDLVVTDEAGRSVLLVEAKGQVGDEFRELVELREHQVRFGFPFAMLANPERILLLGMGDLADPAEPLAELATPETLDAYRSPHVDRAPNTKDDLLLPLARWLGASTEGHLTDQHEGYCCFKRAGLAERLVWGHVLTREMFFAATEPSS